MESKDKLMDMLCMELDEIAQKGEMSAGDLDTVYKLIVSKEKLLRIDELEQDLGYSQDGGWQATGTYSRNGYNNGYAMDAGYRNGNSYANRGKHYVRGHYSRAEGKDMLMQHMQEMMNDGNIASNDRMILQKAMDIMQR